MKPNASPRWTICGASLAGALLLTGCAALNPPRHRASLDWQSTRRDVALQLASENMTIGKFDQARTALAPFNDPNDTPLQLTRARIDIEEGRYEDALVRLDAIKDGRTRLPEYHRLKAIGFEALGRWAEAADEYGRAYGLRADAESLAGWLDTLVLSSQVDLAKVILQRERSRFPGEITLQLLAAKLCQLTGDCDEAVRELETANLARPDSPDIRARLARAYIAARRYAPAIEQLEVLHAAASDPWEQGRLRRQLAECYLATGRPREAYDLYRDLLTLSPDDRELMLGAATAALSAGLDDEALKTADLLLKRNPHSGEARLISGLACRRLGRTDEARQRLSEVRDAGRLAALAAELVAQWR